MGRLNQKPNCIGLRGSRQAEGVNTATEALTSRAVFVWVAEAGRMHRPERLKENGSIRPHHRSTRGFSQLKNMKHEERHR